MSGASEGPDPNDLLDALRYVTIDPARLCDKTMTDLMMTPGRIERVNKWDRFQVTFRPGSPEYMREQLRRAETAVDEAWERNR